MSEKILRIEFKKTDSLIYISHLDLQRTFGRILRKSGIPVKYSSGFNPHMKLVFALTVSVGTESLCELCDVSLDDESTLTPKEAEALLLPNMPKGLELICCKEPDFPFAQIKYANYDIVLDTSESAKRIAEYLDGELVVLKRTKSGEKRVDISPMIKSFEVSAEDKVKITATLAASREEYLNPEYIVKALEEKIKISSYSITRRSLIVDKNC